MPTQAETRSRITKAIVDAIQNDDLPPWRMPWSSHPNGRGLPANAVSKRCYSGINPLLLTLHARRHGFRSRYWATFNQWVEMGATVMHRPSKVPPGQWGCQVVFFRPVSKSEVGKDGTENEIKFPILRTYTLFNADQVHGAEKYRVPDLIINSDFIDFEPADLAIEATGARITYGGDRAFYNRTDDSITMPRKQAFPEPKEFYATALHELAHWTEKRLDWKGSYAYGELRSEICACYALTELGVPQSDDMTNHHAYVKDWLQAIQDDPRVLWQATSAASKACDHILSFSRPVGDVEVPEAVLAC
jgi:antirestriction protein ArdC